jgi:NAD(P)H-hydrate epimerase
MGKFQQDKKFRVMTREQVRAVDNWAINTLGIPGVVLMENAGRSCAEFIKNKLSGKTNPKVCIFCGTGNNGGDGYVIARHLLNSCFKVTVIICGDIDKVAGDAKINLDILRQMGQPIEQLNPKNTEIEKIVQAFAADSDMVVDAIFGTGLKGHLKDEYKRLIEAINALDLHILAVDIPSGLDCDTGHPHGTAIQADYTITFVAVKAGFENHGAAQYAGEVHVASIGIEPGEDLQV